MKWKLFVISILLFLRAEESFAVTFDILSVVALQGDCVTTFSFSLRVDATGTRQDSFYGDYFTFILTDANGQYGAHYDYTIAVGQSINSFSNLGQTYFPLRFATTPVRPFRLELRDTESHWLGGFPVLDSISFDPADFGLCVSKPEEPVEGTEEADDWTASPTPLSFRDGRLNNFDMAAPIVVYGQDFETGRGLVVYSPEGALLLTASAEDLADCPDEHSLIARAEGVSLYHLASCEYQINAASLDGTKTYILIFGSLYPDTGYHSHEE